MNRCIHFFSGVKYTMSEDNTLALVAKTDDMISLCGTDSDLAKKYIKIHDVKEDVGVFDPYVSLASNDWILAEKRDVWTKKSKAYKRSLGAFDPDKYTKLFVELRKEYLEAKEADPEGELDVKEPLRDGFDCYAYLMAYEEDIDTLYAGREDLTRLQKAALHFVEHGNEVKPIDFLKYVASNVDVATWAVQNMPEGSIPNEWLVNFGETHYTASGRNEIHSEVRPIIFIFDAWKYIATHAWAKDAFWNKEENTLDETSATVAYITMGIPSGLVPQGFDANVYLANYPDRVRDDVLVNGKVSTHKASKVWLMNFPEESVLDTFDPTSYIDLQGLKEGANAFEEYVSEKVNSHMKFLKRKKSMLRRFLKCTA